MGRRNGGQRGGSVVLGVGAACALAVWMPSAGEPVTPLPPFVPPPSVEVSSVPPPPAVRPEAPDDVAPQPVDEWGPARALHGPAADLGVLEGHVVGEGGEALAGVLVLARAEEGGVHGARTGPDGAFRFALPVGRLLVSASRWDDLVEVRSEDVLVRLDGQDPRYVPLTLQADAGADAGIVAVERTDGFEVRWAVPGLAAHELGLGPGDRILAVDGRAATSMTLEELERSLVGTEGSAVQLTVEIDGEASTLDVPRWGLDPETLATAQERVDTGPS